MRSITPIFLIHFITLELLSYLLQQEDSRDVHFSYSYVIHKKRISGEEKSTARHVKKSNESNPFFKIKNMMEETSDQISSCQ